MNARKKFRSLINDPSVIIQAVGAHDGLGAKLIEQCGFDAVWASGFEISASYAKPDANILTMTEFVHVAQQLVGSTILPVVADCDTGFGNVNNVVRMVKEYERAGVAAVCIEDKAFPKVNSFVPKRQRLASIEEFSSKIIAAKNTQTDPDFAVIARIESLIVGSGMEETLERATTYCEAGADLILVHSKRKDPGEIFEFSQKWTYDTPLVIVPTTYPNITLEEMKSYKVKMVIYANQALRAAVKAMIEALVRLKQSGSLTDIESRLIPMEEIFRLQGMQEMFEQEELYTRLAKEKQLVKTNRSRCFS